MTAVFLDAGDLDVDDPLPERYVFTAEEAAAELLGVRPSRVAERLRYERHGRRWVYAEKLAADASLGRVVLAWLTAEMDRGR